MTELCEEGMSKPGTGQKLGQMHQRGSRVENAKEKFLEEFKSSAVNARMRKKQNGISGDVEEVSGGLDGMSKQPQRSRKPQPLLEQGSDTLQG